MLPTTVITNSTRGEDFEELEEANYTLYYVLTGVGVCVAAAIGIYYCVKDAKKRKAEKDLFVIEEEEVNPMGIDEIIEAPFEGEAAESEKETAAGTEPNDGDKPAAGIIPVPDPRNDDLVSPDQPRLEARHGRANVT